MVQAFSRLKCILDERGMTVPELHRRMQVWRLSINVKSLYRLAKDRQPM